MNEQYQPDTGTLTLTVRQTCPPSPGQPTKAPYHIPFALGLLGPDGASLPVRLAVEDPSQNGPTTRILELKQPEQGFTFVDLPHKPVVSPLRGFSAPVKLSSSQSLEERLFLYRHDTDTFNRWDAGQQLATRLILEQMAEPERPLDARFIAVFRELLAETPDDPAYLALLLTLPTEDYLHAAQTVVDPDATHQARQAVRRALVGALRSDFEALYAAHADTTPLAHFDPACSGRRRLKNVCLSWLNELNDAASQALVLRQYHEARNMTDVMAALTCLVNSDHPEKAACLEHFHSRWQQEALVIDKWFALQATCHWPGTLQRVQTLLEHPAFDLTAPNRVRSLIGAFSQSNPVSFHVKTGEGYVFLADQVLALDRLNPQIAARMLTALSGWQRYDSLRQNLMREQLQRIVATESLSRDVYEVASKGLDAGG